MVGTRTNTFYSYLLPIVFHNTRNIATVENLTNLGAETLKDHTDDVAQPVPLLQCAPSGQGKGGQLIYSTGTVVNLICTGTVQHPTIPDQKVTVPVERRAHAIKL